MNYEVWGGCYLQRLKIPNSNRASIFDTMRMTLTGYNSTLTPIAWPLTIYWPIPRMGCNFFTGSKCGDLSSTYLAKINLNTVLIPGEGQGAQVLPTILQNSTKCPFKRPGKTRIRSVKSILALFCYFLTFELFQFMGVLTTHRINLSMWILIYSFSDTYYIWATCEW